VIKGFAVEIARTDIVRCVLFVLVGLAATNVFADDESDQGRALLDNFLKNVHGFSAHFEQTLVDPDGDVLETSSGTVNVRRPDQFRWAYTEPYEQVLLADGRNVWSYDVDLAQVTVRAQTDVLRNTPAALLGGSEQVLDDFDYVGSFTDRGNIWVQLKPKATDNGFNNIELGFRDGDLTRMMFVDTLGQTTLVALMDISINDQEDDDFFEFVLADGVDLVGVPIAKVADAADTAEQ